MIDVQASRCFDQPAEQLWSLCTGMDAGGRSRRLQDGPLVMRTDARERPPPNAADRPPRVLEAVNPWDCPPGNRRCPAVVDRTVNLCRHYPGTIAMTREVARCHGCSRL